MTRPLQLTVPDANMQMAYVLRTGSNMSAKAPPTMAMGALAARPARNLPNMIVSTFCATATGMVNMANAM